MRRMVPLLAALALAAGNAAAQDAPPDLRARMDGFAAALRDRAPMEEIAAYFPRHSAWEMVETYGAATPAGRHRFAPAHTLAAIREGGPVCGSFGGVTGDVGPYEGALVMQVGPERPWRFVGRGRFVPPERGPRSPIFVEWSREDGRWVIARVGEEALPALPRRFPPSPHEIVRGGGNADAAVGFARGTPWYDEHAPLYVRGRAYVKYGPPRRLAQDDLQRFGSIHGVPVFVELGGRATAEVLYVLFAPGEYQPYEGFGHSICRR